MSQGKDESLDKEKVAKYKGTSEHINTNKRVLCIALPVTPARTCLTAPANVVARVGLPLRSLKWRSAGACLLCLCVAQTACGLEKTRTRTELLSWWKARLAHCACCCRDCWHRGLGGHGLLCCPRCQQWLTLSGLHGGVLAGAVPQGFLCRLCSRCRRGCVGW